MVVSSKGYFLDVKSFVSKKNGKSYSFVGFYSSDGDTVSMFCPDNLVSDFKKYKRFDEITVSFKVGYDSERGQIRYSIIDLVD